MTSSRTRKRQNRRDRRKAKASCWRRPGKQKPGRVGHGPSGVDEVRTERKRRPKKPAPPPRVLRVVGNGAQPRIPRDVILAIRREARRRNASE